MHIKWNTRERSKGRWNSETRTYDSYAPRRCS